MSAKRVPALGGCGVCLADRTVPLRNGSGKVQCVECGRTFRPGGSR